jgi:hypothetical protein
MRDDKGINEKLRGKQTVTDTIVEIDGGNGRLMERQSEGKTD